MFFNARTSALLLLDEHQTQIAKKRLLNISTKANDISEKLKNLLLNGGFLISNETDELNEVRKTIHKKRFNSNILRLTIAPTMACNFDCTYCFLSKDIRNDTHIMTEQIRIDLISFVKQYINQIKSLNVLWYGGEPLLALKTVEDLSYELLQLCKENKVKYSACISSNGYLLHESIIDRLIDCDISSVQITLDGPPQVHDKRRRLKNKAATFNKVIKNISALAHKIPIVIRINVDEQNKNQLCELLNIVRKSKSHRNITVYLARTTLPSIYKGCDHPVIDCIDAKEFSQLMIEFEKLLLKYGFQTLDTEHFKSRGDSCGAGSTTSFVIDPRGNLYLCEENLGKKEKIIGDIKQSKMQLFNKSCCHSYINFDPTTDSICSKCSTLPICLGGCPRERIENKKPRCDIIKYNLKERLLLFVNNNRSRIHLNELLYL